jgi:ArsR family transcriptional regulator, virulence genes transcriptional regulator
MDTNFREEACKQAALYKLLSNEKRVMILWLLSESEMSVSELAANIGTTLQNVSQHLRLMRDHGLLESCREGQAVYYHLAANKFSYSDRLLIQPRLQPPK